MTEITPLAFEGTPLRFTESGDLVAADLARALGYSSAKDMTRILDEDERGRQMVPTPGGDQEMTTVTEAGFYRVCMARQAGYVRDDFARAYVKRLQRWVTHEVLPSIRKHGGYLTPEATEAALTDPDFIIRLATDLKAERARRAELEVETETQRRHLAVISPKADAFDRWLSTNPDYSVDEVAKALRALGVDTGRNRLHAYLGKSRDAGGIGWTYPVTRGHRPMQAQVETGRLALKLGHFDNSKTGEVEATSTVRITAKGAAWLAVHFGVLPESVAANLDDTEDAA